MATRQEALFFGLARYTSLCPQGHDERYTDSGSCVRCVRDKYRTDVEWRARDLWKRARSRAQLRGNSEFSLTQERVIHALKLGICEATGVPFVLERHAQQRQHPYAPSIDRVDRHQIYSDSTVRIVTWQYNRAKERMSDHQFLEFCRLVVRKGGAQ